MNNEIEIWKNIEGFEEVYQVSNLGRVRGLDRTCVNSLGIIKTYKGKILSQRYYKNNVIVVLNVGSRSVASLCARAFIHNNTPYQTVIHKDKNKFNNKADNLMYGTHKTISPKNKLLTNFQKYDNLEDITIFISENKNCVIYKLINTFNNKFYIGSAKNFYNRAMRHLAELNKGSHKNKHLQNSWNKYGSGNFKFEILEECLESIKIEREQYYLDLLKPFYNINPKAGGGHVEDSCTIDVRKKITDSNLKRWSEMSIEKREEIRKNMSTSIKEKNKNKSNLNSHYGHKYKPVCQYDLNGTFINEFINLKEAASAVNLSSGLTISLCCKGRNKTAANYIWKYKSNI